MSGFLKGLGAVFRGIGQGLDKTGVAIQGKNSYVERVPIHARYLSVGGKPSVSSPTFVAPNASLIGNVSLGEYSSVFYNSIVVAANKQSVVIEGMSAVGDNSTIRATQSSVSIGKTVYIGSGASLMDCTVKSGAHIGNGAMIQKGVVVEEHAVVAPGSVVAENTTVPSGELWAGSPAQFVRKIEAHEQDMLVTAAAGTHWVSRIHHFEASKTSEQIGTDRANYEREWETDVDFGSTVLNYEEPRILPQLANFIYPIQLRTYLEPDRAIPEDTDRVVVLKEGDDVKKIMEDVLAQQGKVGQEYMEDKKSYWFVN